MVVLADEDEDGNFPELASLVKGQPENTYNHNFPHHPSFSSSHQWHNGDESFHSRYDNFIYHNGNNGGIRRSYTQPPSENQGSCHRFDNMDSRHHFKNRGFSHMCNLQRPNDKLHGRGDNFQPFYNRENGRGRGWRFAFGHGRGGSSRYHYSYDHHDSAGQRDVENFQLHCNGEKGHTHSNGQKNEGYVRVHGYSKTWKRGGSFLRSLKKVGCGSGNKALIPRLVTNEVDTHASLSADVHTNSDLQRNENGMDSTICSKGILATAMVDLSLPQERKDTVKQKKASVSRQNLPSSLLSCLRVAPVLPSGCHEGNLLKKDTAIGVQGAHQDRAFISCIGGNRKRRRPSAVRDYPIGCGKFLSSLKLSPSLGTPSMKETGCTSEDCRIPVGDEFSRELVKPFHEVTKQIWSIKNITEEHVDQAKTIDRDNEIFLTKEDGPVELVQPAGLEVMFENPSKTYQSGRKTDLTTKDCPGELVHTVPHAIKCNGEHSSQGVVQSTAHITINHSGRKTDLTTDYCTGEHVHTVPQSMECIGEHALQGQVQLTAYITTNHSGRKTDVTMEDRPGELVHTVPQAIECNGEHAPQGRVQSTVHIRTNQSGQKTDSTTEDCPGEVVHTVPQALRYKGQHAPQCQFQLSVDITPNYSGRKTDSSTEDCPGELIHTVPQAIKRDGQHASQCPVQSTAHITLDSSDMKPPSEMHAVPRTLPEHVASQEVSSSNEQERLLVDDDVEMQFADCSIVNRSQQNKLNNLVAASTDLTPELENGGHVAKKLKVKHSSQVSENAGAAVLYQSNRNGGSVKNKDPIKRLIHKGNTRLNPLQRRRNLDSVALTDPEKGSCSEANEGLSARTLVKRTLHEYESIRKMLVKSRDGTKMKRADLDAASILKERGKWRNCEEKVVGDVPGVEVGDQFSFRMEMLIIGLHRQVQSGIDYIPGTRRTCGSPLATSIVASGGYDDDKDDGNTLIYSGQGGANKGRESSQKLVRGNLAMSNSMKEKTPVRVIRGTTDLASPSSKIYTYDGLYDVVNYRFETNAAGFGVYHFTLSRRSGQPQVGLSFVCKLKKRGLARPYLLLDDISIGQERLPVCVVNEVDNEAAPTQFLYISKIKYPLWHSPLPPQGCDCVGACDDEERCGCASKNGGEIPYNEKGYIIRDKKVVYECGSSCRCSSSCQNRVSQNGLRYRLEVFKTKNRGWGVRSLDSIQPGGFICEYTGELLSDKEAEQKVENDEYLFDLGNECSPSGDEAQSSLIDLKGSSAIAEDVGYTIDAKDLGNVARFINHSCSPNLYAQNVLYDSDDLRFPHVMLFAMENIPPMRELTYDYNYSIDQVRDAHGNVKTKACYCGAQDCQGRLY